jgi:cytochrome P450
VSGAARVQARGVWALSRFADVTGAAKDHEHFITRQGVTVPALGLPIASVPLTTDPPEHKFYRRALQPFFTPAAVEQMEDHTVRSSSGGSSPSRTPATPTWWPNWPGRSPAS